MLCWRLYFAVEVVWTVYDGYHFIMAILGNKQVGEIECRLPTIFYFLPPFVMPLLSQEKKAIAPLFSHDGG